MGKKKVNIKTGLKKKPKLSKVKKQNIETYKRLKQRKTALKEANEQAENKDKRKIFEKPEKSKKKSKRAQKIQSLAQAAGVAPRKRQKNFHPPERTEEDDYYDVIQSGDEEAVADDIEDEADEMTETLEDDHLDFIETVGGGSDFLTGIEDEDKDASRKRKKKEKEKENVLPSFEQQPRATEEGLQSTKKMKKLLPVKTSTGLEYRYAERTDEMEVEESVLPEKKSTPEEALPAISAVQLFAQRREKIAKKKQEIALLASAVLENPERNIGKLKDLRDLLDTDEMGVALTVKKLVMVSLNEVFIDLIPGYRIREFTEKEKQTQLSKEVKIKRDYEEALLKHYQRYLEYLENLVNGLNLKAQGKKGKLNRDDLAMSAEARLSISTVAVESLCKLLLAASHFNFSYNIISVIVFLMKNSSEKIADTCIKCISQLFREDSHGNVSAEAVKFIGRMLKGRNYKVKAKVLDTLLHLKIKEAIVKEEASIEEKKRELLKRKERIKKMSRSQRRYNKQMERLEKEMKSTEASEDKKKRMIVQTEIIQNVFAIYFRILKQASDSSLLPSVLEGLAKFAHLINVEFFDDLVKVLHDLIASQTLAPRESLHCVLTAFNILSGQGDALNIDPSRFYSLFYVNLLNVHAGQTCDDALLILQCMDAMVNKRHKHVSVQRVLAYLKRLSTISLQNLPNACIGFLCAMRNVMKLYPKTDILLDSESVGSGTFMSEVTEPEHSHAQNTTLWELQLLKNHYHPVVQQFSRHLSLNSPLSGVGALPTSVSRSKPDELYKDFDPRDMTFNPPVLTRKDGSKPKKTSNHLKPTNLLQEDFAAYIKSFNQDIKNPSDET